MHLNKKSIRQMPIKIKVMKMLAAPQKKKRGLTLFLCRGTGIPFERNRQAHAILSYSMNIVLSVSFK